MSGRRIPTDKRKRTETSCDICRLRKQKCDKPADHELCRYCKIHSLECTAHQPRKKRLYGSLEGVGTRIQLLESLVKGLMPEANLTDNDQMRQLGTALGIPLPAEDVGQTGLESEVQAVVRNEVLPLLPDQQGQRQWTGPSSSFSFHLKLRTLLDEYSTYEFVLFGPNAAEHSQEARRMPGITAFSNGEHANSLQSSVQGTSLNESHSDVVADVELSSELVRSYFDIINPDFAVLHEASFRATYETWSRAAVWTDRVWLCSLLCVFILASRTTTADISKQQQRKWWQQVQELLPTVVFASSVAGIQALMLAALHLHHTNHRDACWNLTGTAVRIAHGIGLHCDDVRSQQSPLMREFRKLVWWTLFAFEQLQVSSYDRPSAIVQEQCSVESPDERIIGMGSYHPPDMIKCQNRLTTLLCTTCRVRNLSTSGFGEQGSLAPAASALRELFRWKEALPSHLRLEAVDLSPPCYRRPILLLHAQYHYCSIVLSRSALLHRATVLTQAQSLPSSRALLAPSEACRESGRLLCQVVKQLHAHGKFNAFTWFDIFYSITAALCLVLDIVCSVRQHTESAESMQLLEDLAELATSHMRQPRMPGTLRKWASLITELAPMVRKYAGVPRRQQDGTTSDVTQPRGGMVLEDARLLMDLRERQVRPEAPSVPTQQTVEASSDWWSPFTAGFDGQTTSLPEWHWDDIEAVLNG